MTKREQNAYWKGRQYLLRAKAQELYLHHFSLKVKIYQNGGRFQYQRSEVQIQSSAKIYLNRTFVYCQLCIEKTKITKKRPGMAHLKKQFTRKQKKHTISTCFILTKTLLHRWESSVNGWLRMLIIMKKTLFNSNIIFTEIIKALKCRSSLQFVNTEDCHE